MADDTEKQKPNSGRGSGLKPFKKGQSGNPNGRPPKGHAIADILDEIGKQCAPQDLAEKLRKVFPTAGTITMRHAMLYRAYLDAIKGDKHAIQFIAERTEGKPKQPIEFPNINSLRIDIDGGIDAPEYTEQEPNDQSTSNSAPTDNADSSTGI